MSPRLAHVLDWFHVTIWVAVANNIGNGLPEDEQVHNGSEYLKGVKRYLVLISLWFLVVSLSRPDLSKGNAFCIIHFSPSHKVDPNQQAPDEDHQECQ